MTGYCFYQNFYISSIICWQQWSTCIYNWNADSPWENVLHEVWLNIYFIKVWPIIWLNIYIKLIWYSLVKWSGKLWSHGTWRTEEMPGPYPNQGHWNKWTGDRPALSDQKVYAGTKSRDQAFLWRLACSERWADHRQFVHNILIFAYFQLANTIQPSFPSQILFACVHLNRTQANETWQNKLYKEIMLWGLRNQ